MEQKILINQLIYLIINEINLLIVIIFILNDSKLFLIYRNEIVVLSKENEEIFNENSNPFGLLVPCQFLSFIIIIIMNQLKK
ncbi:unnamed protein product [Rotaria magnacalcarata]